MTLTADAFIEASRAQRGACSLVAIRDALSAKDRAALDAALANPAVTHQGIAAVLRSNGHTVQGSTISRHRRGLCSCPRRATT